MTPQERESFYDIQVAPVLRELNARCVAKGLSFLAVVEWAPGEHGRTFGCAPMAGLGIKLANAAAHANGNADVIIWAMMDHAHKHGHGSACLRTLGVPEKPASAKP